MITTRTIVAENGNQRLQELNELASLILSYCDNNKFEENVTEASEWAKGYNQSLNTIESLITGLPSYLVAK